MTSVDIIETADFCKLLRGRAKIHFLKMSKAKNPINKIPDLYSKSFMVCDRLKIAAMDGIGTLRFDSQEAEDVLSSFKNKTYIYKSIQKAFNELKNQFDAVDKNGYVVLLPVEEKIGAKQKSLVSIELHANS